MSQNINILPLEVSKEEKYQSLLPQIKSLVNSETDLIANMANISAALKQVFNFFWVGFYIIKENELVLGPFQGTIACTRIKYGRGVCGAAWKDKETIIVPNVKEFPGHIACDINSRSEIVIPVFKDKEIVSVLDVDSEHLNHFDLVDAKYLQKITALLY